MTKEHREKIIKMLIDREFFDNTVPLHIITQSWDQVEIKDNEYQQMTNAELMAEVLGQHVNS